MRNGNRGSSVEGRASRVRRLRAQRRGVLLLVVLSMLVLFMLIGTAFLMTSDQSRTQAKASAKRDQYGNVATRLLDRAMLQLVRDTDNPASAIRYHSLLRDLYGTDGFSGVACGFTTGDPVDLLSKLQTPRYAEATAAPLPPSPGPLGPTSGQFIDIYFKKLGFGITTAGQSEDDPQTAANESQITIPDLRHVLKLDRDPYGKQQMQVLPTIKGYYNGCLLTITSGPAAGKTTRILDYQLMQNITNSGGKTVAQLYRIRVMAFSRADGQPLTVSSTRSPEIEELAGIPGVTPPATFMVNGRAYSGTGVGYNPLATTGQPRLSALQLFPVGGGNYIGAELALLPNASTFNPLSTTILTGAAPLSVIDPFTTPLPLGQVNATTPQYQVLNNPSPTAGSPFFFYPTYVGPGGANEGYEAPDFQNTFLALQTVTPRGQGRVVHSSSSGPVTLDLSDPLVLGDTKNFLRLDLEDLPLPSFHRPDLVNYWYHRLFRLLTDPNGLFKLNSDVAVQAILQPYADDQWNLSPALKSNAQGPQIAALISAIKRQAMFRPTREDNPHFDGSNPLSTPADLSKVTPLSLNGNIAVPFWEATGPWDVDNDNDGVRDSVWVDLGDPIQETEDGRRYKTLYAILCVDLDGRLNVNAHGMADDLLPPLLDTTKANFFDLTRTGSGWVGNLAHDPSNPPPVYSTLQLSRGLGYGPAEISLRPVFPAPTDPSYNPLFTLNRSESAGPIDSYAALLAGRLTLDKKVVSGRYGSDLNLGAALLSQSPQATAGANYAFSRRRPNIVQDPLVPPDLPPYYTGEQASPSLAAQLKFFNYPWSVLELSAFGTPPDLKGRYALGLDYTGQPVYEVANDINPNTIGKTQLPFNLLAKSPYELDLTSAQRRDSWASSTDVLGPFKDASTAYTTSLTQSDDAPFSPTDLEKVLRGWDADAGTLPSRLWDVVNEFDPIKLMNYDPNRVEQVANLAFGSTATPQLLTAAQEIAGISRRLVTTDSYSLPVANQVMPGYVSEFGPDGVPGRRGQSNQVLNQAGTDDFQVVTGVSRAQAKISDLLRYRVWLEARRYEMRRQGLTEAALDAMTTSAYTTFMNQINTRANAVFVASPQLVSELLAPEVIAGKRMDLNRPFGDGKDNNGDGVVDDPLEAGEPFLDLNGNGKRDDGTNGTPVEPFIDLNGNGVYDAPGDQLWSSLWPKPLGGDGTMREPISFDYTNGHAEPLHATVLDALKKNLNVNVVGGVRNLESQGRQLFARHLYCLMLLLVDDGFIAPWDENDPQLMTWMATERARLVAAKPALSMAEADVVVKRRLTCKMIAQWAVNVVDARDADSIMTPFEYTDNPWFGWGVWDDKWAGDPLAWPSNPTDPKFPRLIPLDGDPATDENQGVVIDWSVMGSASGSAKALKQLSVDTTQTTGASLVALGAANPAVITHPLNQSRGLVWGAERPELLISETLAFHDRRTEDLQSADKDGHDNFSNTKKHKGQTNNSTDYYDDYDLDQSLRPRGSLYVELKNPWSQSGQLPLELYSKVDSAVNWNGTTTTNVTASRGVELGRLSNYGANVNFNSPTSTVLTPNASAGTIRRSPVWRIVVVEEDPAYRSREYKDINSWLNAPHDATLKLDSSTSRDAAPKSLTAAWNIPFVQATDAANQALAQKAYQAAVTAIRNWNTTVSPLSPLPPFRPSNPDFTEAFNIGYKPVQPDGTKNVFEVKYPYVEREFYFTTDNSKSTTVTKYNAGKYGFNPDFKLWIPDRSFTPANGQYPPSHLNEDATKSSDPWQTQRFIARALAPNSNTFQDIAISPILPGRYGVIGSIGNQYKNDSTDLRNINLTLNGKTITAPRFINMIGRTTDGNPGYNTLDDSMDPNRTRRIEMWPNANPDVNQLMVGANGGYDPNKDPQNPGPTGAPLLAAVASKMKLAADIRRSNELIAVPPNPQPKNIYTESVFQPCVAIPVDGMSVSEPPWGWSPREYEAAQIERERKKAAKGGSPTTKIFGWNPALAMGEGRYFGTNNQEAQSYDVPFDTAPELVRTGTTSNYRTIHLQRLANPLLPWNPPPGQIKDVAGNDQNQPNLPVNPYLTVDTASVDLTAFNGVSEGEGNYPDRKGGQTSQVVQGNLGQFRPWVPKEAPLPLVPNAPGFYYNMAVKGTQIWQFKSRERGLYSQLSTTHLFNQLQPLPQRVLMAQEPVVGSVADVNTLTANSTGYQAISDGRLTSTKIDDVPESIKGRTKPIAQQAIPVNHMDMVLEHSLGFGNESDGKLYTQTDAPVAAAVGAPAASTVHDSTWAIGDPQIKGKHTTTSTYSWLAWDNRPFASAEEILKVPAASQAQMLRMYSTVNPNTPGANQLNPYGLAVLGVEPSAANNYAMVTNKTRWQVFQAAFGHLADMFAASGVAGNVVRDFDIRPTMLPSGYQITGAPVRFDANGAPILPDDPTKDGNVVAYGAPNFARILEYVQVPSKYVGTDTNLTAEIFNDVPTRVAATEPVGTDITDPTDPRYNFQPPFNKVSRERDPGKVNLNTVTGRRIPPATSTSQAQIWSEVFDGIMHRFHDGNMTSQGQLSHFGPAWRDVVLSRRGYLQVDAAGNSVDKPPAPPNGTNTNLYPDTFAMGLNNSFPTFFANPFRSASAGDLVPLSQMMQFGVDASMERGHPWTRGLITDASGVAKIDPAWGGAPTGATQAWPTGYTPYNDARDAGVGNDGLSFRADGAVPNSDPTQRDILPLFSDQRTATWNNVDRSDLQPETFTDANRNSYMMYEPMSRLGNLVTNRSGVYAVWITVGYFEVEKAPDWNDPDATIQANVRAHFGGDINLYNRVYPDGYMLGKELGSETGDVKRPRGFYIIDRTEEVGFKPGEDINVENTVRLRRRIE